MYGFRIRNFRIFQIFAYPLFLFVPTIGIAIICCSIIWLVRKRSKDNVASKKEKQHTKERQAVVQLTLIILSFLLGYLPFIGNVFIYGSCCIGVLGHSFSGRLGRFKLGYLHTTRYCDSLSIASWVNNRRFLSFHSIFKIAATAYIQILFLEITEKTTTTTTNI